MRGGVWRAGRGNRAGDEAEGRWAPWARSPKHQAEAMMPIRGSGHTSERRGNYRLPVGARMGPPAQPTPAFSTPRAAS